MLLAKSMPEFLYGIASSLYMVQANLTNYFDYDFGDSPQLAAFQLYVQTNSLEFPLKSDIQLPVVMKFLRTTESVKLADVADGEDFWRIKCVCPAGERINVSGRSGNLGGTNDAAAVKENHREIQDYKIVELSSNHPYTRDLSISKLIDFSHPGTYRIRLSYDNISWRATNDTAKDLWGGYFCSPIFTVTIKP